jgi:hypothetical protein
MTTRKLELSDQSKQTMARQTPTIAAIQDLLLPHMLLGGKEKLYRDELRVTTPRCLFDRSTATSGSRCYSALGLAADQRKQQLTPHFIPGPHRGNTTAEVRDALSHDHRCRSATTLYELATAVYGMLEGVQVDHERRLAEMKKELAVARKQTTEWQHHFGPRGCTPLEVELEMRSLRQEVEDLRREKAALEAKVRHHAQHVDCLYHLLPATAVAPPQHPAQRQ